MRIESILEEVKRLAVKAGEFIAEQRQHFDASKVESKHSHDYVSYVDKQCEQMIVARLKEILPEAGFITEEKTIAQKEDEERPQAETSSQKGDEERSQAETSSQKDDEAGLCWVVDPLDGTTNFIHDLAPYCVCIALRNQTDILLGVVYEVTRQELYSAGKGLGAWLNGQPIHVSRLTDLDQALVMIGYPYNAEGYRQFCLNLTGQLYGHCASIRSNGSAEGELCYLASGKIDVYVESFIQSWDVAAGACILMEAGGKISDYDGTDNQWESGRQVVATNGLLHEAVLEEIRKARP